MGRRGALSQAEKSKIIQRLHDNISTLEISRELDHDHRTIKKFVTSPELCNGRSDKGKIRKKAPVLHRAMSRIKKEIRRNPLWTSKGVFENADVPDVTKSTRWRILRNVAKCGIPEVCPPLKDVHKKKRMEWAKKSHESQFSNSFVHRRVSSDS